MALNAYFDASVIVALLLRDDDFNSRADDFIRRYRPIPIVSDFASVEFASAVARRVRMKDLTPAEARNAFQNFDNWKTGAVNSVQIASADLVVAERSLRRLGLALRSADAIHIGTAARLGAELATFDEKMAASARALGVKLAQA